MTPEGSRQFNLFSGELDDTRTRRQKRLDREREQLQQQEMFSQRDIAQFGVKAHPLLPLSPNTRLILIPEDPRTPEEVARDIQQAAESLTKPLFQESSLEPDDTEFPPVDLPPK